MCFTRTHPTKGGSTEYKRGGTAAGSRCLLRLSSRLASRCSVSKVRHCKDSDQTGWVGGGRRAASYKGRGWPRCTQSPPTRADGHRGGRPPKAAVSPGQLSHGAAAERGSTARKHTTTEKRGDLNVFLPHLAFLLTELRGDSCSSGGAVLHPWSPAAASAAAAAAAAGGMLTADVNVKQPNKKETTSSCVCRRYLSCLQSGDCVFPVMHSEQFRGST